jgi:5'-3' exonuclease
MKKLPKKSLVVDISNILFRVSAVQKNSPYSRDASLDELVGLCMHISLYSIFKWYNKFKPDFVVFAFEGGNIWRKDYTTTENVRRAYKGNRVIDPEMKHYYQLIEAFRETISAHTSVCCLCIGTMEADDAIAAYCQLYARPDHDIYIISGDRDFTQLLSLPGVKLVNPDNGKLRNQPGDKDYEPDLDYWIFKKCIRGDGGDNVPSAYPKVRETRIRKAYENQYERVNFMNEVWVEKKFITDDQGNQLLDAEGKLLVEEVKHRVGDLYEQNIVLMDLYKQPADQRLILEEGVKMQVENINNYSHFHFLRFLGEFRLQKVSEEAIRFVDMLANNQRFLKDEKKPEVKKVLVEEPMKKTTNLLDF